MDEGRRLRDEGMTQAEKAESDTWLGLAGSVALELAWSSRPFSIDDITDRVGPPVHPNATGSVLMSLSRRGLIERVGFTESRHPQRHAHRNPLWRGTAKAVASAPFRDTLFGDLT